MLSKDFEIYYYKDHYLSKVESHTHNYYEFYFFLEGDVDIQIGAQCYPLKYGDVVLIPPGISHHAVVRDTKQPYRRFVFWITEEYSRQLQKLSETYGYLMQYVERTGDYILHNDVITFNSIQTKVFHLIEEIHTNRFGKEAMISLCVSDLLMHLNRIAYEQRQSCIRNEGQSLYENLLAYMEEHLEEELSLDRLAREFYVSKYYIAHLFKENTGISIHQYIVKKRLALCRDAILNHVKITEACQMYGFKEYSAFYRAFYKEYGISPKECREREEWREKL